MHQFIAIWFGWIRDWHYLGVFVMMAIESSIVPIPSELIIPPAAYWVTRKDPYIFETLRRHLRQKAYLDA